MKVSPQYLTEAQVSDMTGIAVSTLRNHRFLRCGLSYIKLDRMIRYKVSDVINYMESRRIDFEEVDSFEK